MNAPDENLVKYFEDDLFNPGKVLELGCGPGRNALFFAEKGCSIDAVDISQETLNWARERAIEKSINVIKSNMFDLDIKEESYDIVYDSGCFHHIPPHRRMSYLQLVKRALKPNGFFALTCFLQGGELTDSVISDWDVYKLRSLQGGLGYTEEKLKLIFKDFKVIEIRNMKEQPHPEVFGVNGLLTAVFQK